VFQVTITAETSARGGLGALAVQGLKADAALVAVEDGVFERVDALVLVELTVDAATLGRMRELAQDELGLHEPAVVLQRGRETPVRASPRGLPDSRLWHVGAAQDSPAGGRLRHSVKPNLIHQQWDELLRLAASLRDGTVTASLLVARLHAQQRRSVTARPARDGSSSRAWATRARAPASSSSARRPRICSPGSPATCRASGRFRKSSSGIAKPVSTATAGARARRSRRSAAS
jgi:hypothetical protein